jgi:hypothetical protein
MALTAATVDQMSFATQFRAITRSTRGLIEAAAGDLAAAREFHAGAMEMAVESADFPVVALCLVGVADLALRSGDPAGAARLLGAADAVRGSIDRSVPDVDRIADEARAALGGAGFEAAYRSGSSVTFETAIEAAGLAADPGPSRSDPAPSRSDPAPSGSDPAPERPHGERGEDHEQSGGPQH